MSDFSNEITDPHWYVAHTYSGYENKVKANLEKIVENRSLQHLIKDIRIPVEITIENEGEENEKKIETKTYPSYVFIKMVMTDESWHVVRNITGVTGFVGPGSKPVPLTDDEVEAMQIDQIVVNLKCDIGDTVRIVSGSLAGFVGTVSEISEDKKKIIVMASMFGRDTPVEVDSDGVEPIE